ncbi:MAG: TolC family protein, partial [Chlorobi bacterium]|nr:TolC family protein [Chlorobiota bacterium]
LFSAEKEKLNVSENLMVKKKFPLIAGFGQFGYARPGLNILNPDLTDYYLVGLSLKWNIWDWGEMKKNKQQLSLTKEMINNREENFRKNITTVAGIEKNKLKQIKELIQKDNEIIQLKEQIAKESSNALENGTKTTTDYLSDLNAEKKARLNKAIHEIELSKTEINLRTVTGQISMNISN